MENASKALIIAGAILLAILLISLGILVFNQASESANANALNDAQKTSFNQKFTKYEGDRVKGSMVKTLVQEIIASNSNPDNVDSKYIVQINGANVTTSAASKYSTNSSYKVVVEFDTTTGVVNNVNITAAT